MQRSRPRSRVSYTARRGERQSLPYFRAAVLGAIGTVVAGCSTATYDPIQTAGIVSTISDNVDPSDWEAVRRTVAEIGAEALDRPWQNPRTGSSGTVSATAMEPKAGGVCRAFTPTVNDIRGIRAYRGEACRSGAADWQIGAIVPEDSKLL